MAHEHRWIDVSTLDNAYETRLCVECHEEQYRAFCTDDWVTSLIFLPRRKEKGE